MKSTFIKLQNESLPNDIGQELLIVNNITITNSAASSIEFLTNGGYFDTQQKSLETRSEAECF